MAPIPTQQAFLFLPPSIDGAVSDSDREGGAVREHGVGGGMAGNGEKGKGGKEKKRVISCVLHKI